MPAPSTIAADPEDQREEPERVFQNSQSDQTSPTQHVEQASEQAEKFPDENEAYSILTTAQKKAIVLRASFCAFFSPTTASIYYPAVNVIAHDLHVSNTADNLTVTTYLVNNIPSLQLRAHALTPKTFSFFKALPQPLSPAFPTAPADPAFFICFTLCIAANVGLGSQNRYAALLVLRCLQIAGSSSTVALSDGIAADVVSSAKRGSYVTIASMGALIGPMYGHSGVKRDNANIALRSVLSLAD